MTGQHAHRPVQRPAIAAFLLGLLLTLYLAAAYVPTPRPDQSDLARLGADRRDGAGQPWAPVPPTGRDLAPPEVPAP